MITHVLALDPSGNFREGKGTTGWVLMQLPEKLVARGCIKAEEYNTQEEYWDAHLNLLKYNFKRHNKHLVVVIEDYILYENRAYDQINSQLETCRLIGILQWFCWKHNQKYVIETAAQVKTRWSDYILSERGIIFTIKNKQVHAQSGLELNNHTRDALRHALHFIYCKNNQEKPKRKKQKINKLSNYKGGKPNASYKHNARKWS